MTELIRFALIGVGVGALFALASQGLVIIYRGSGVLNLALGAIGLSGTYVYAELRNEHGVATWLAVVVGVLFSALLGALSHLLVMRQLRRASPLARVIATLGILIVLQSLAVLRYGGRVTFVEQFLPADIYHLGSDITISADRIILLVIAVALTVVLFWIYQRTRFGLATSAVAEDERLGAALGWSPDVIATGNWALGSGLAGLAAILIAPIVTLQVGVMTSLLLAALATALVASFRSFPLVLAAGIGMGVVQSVLKKYTNSVPGLAESVPFIVIVLVLVFRGNSLPLRDYLLQRLPAVGSGLVRLPVVAFGVLVAAAVILFTPVAWVDATSVGLATAIVLLSIVVLTGYTGQLSLAQFAFAGFGALVAGRLISSAGAPVLLAVAAGVLLTVPLGMLFALPALRTRGITLAVVTLGLGSAVQSLVLNNGDFTGGLYGVTIGRVNVFGWAFDGLTHPRRYAFVVLAGFALTALMVANVRRGPTGRRLIAVRTNERAAAALGLNVRHIKLYSFGLAAGIAALGGIALTFDTDAIVYTTGFDPITSISAVGWTVIGGLGFIFGSVIGANLAPGAWGQVFSNQVLGGVGRYLPLIGGILLILLILGNQDGSVKEMAGQIEWVRRKLRIPPRRRRSGPPLATGGQAVRVEPRILELRGVSVRFGTTLALDDVSFAVEPGEVVGLIGPNGAGKTTLIDAVTGFAPLAAGEVLLDGDSIVKLPAERRARLGISRSFQSLELFEDSSVLDNLRIACDDPGLTPYVRDLVLPKNPELPPEVVSIIHEFGLIDDLETEVQALSFGKRHLLALARAVASRPSVLLLDEPAAGLSDAETMELVGVVRRLAGDWGMAVLLIEHDMNFVMAVCDRLVVLDFGSVIATGDPAAIQRDPLVLAAYLGELEDPHTDEAADHDAVDPDQTVSAGGHR